MNTCSHERLVRLAGQAVFPRSSSRKFMLVMIMLAMTAVSLPAQLHTMLHCFTNSPDGGQPFGDLVLSGNILYGTTKGGGANGFGTVFQINTDGSGFKVIKDFSAGAATTSGLYTNWDGINPMGGLLLIGGTLYGTTGSGGLNGSGTVFLLGTNGSGFTVLKHFSAAAPYGGVWTNADGSGSSGRLALGGGTLYGTLLHGGINGFGTLFKINTNGGGFAVIHTFTKGPGSDGSNPYPGLVLSGNTLYGTTEKGGTNDSGTVFKISTNGSGFTLIKTLSVTGYDDTLRTTTNSDGAYPTGGLALSGGMLYGTTGGGGTLGGGTVFQVNTNGSGFAVLKSFTGPLWVSSTIGYTNGPDAYSPFGGVVLSNDALYGTALRGGWPGTLLGLGPGSGGVFRINTNGSGYAVLTGFCPVAFDNSNNYTNSEGAYPYAGLVLGGSTLYGATAWGNSSGYGTLFSVQIQPAFLSLARTNRVITFAWSTVVGQTYRVQYISDLLSTNWLNLGSPFTAAASTMATFDGVTNQQRFYRIEVQP